MNELKGVKSVKSNRVETIIDSALKLYIRDGYSSLTMAKIAEEAEISRSTLYKSYKVPADILLDYIGKWFDSRTIELLAVDESNINPIYRIVAMIDLDSDFKQLAAIYPSVLEVAATDVHLVKFRKKFKRFIDILGIITTEFDPSISYEEYCDYYRAFLIIALGTMNLYTYDSKIIETCEALGEKYIEYGVCEVAIKFFANVPGIEEALPYWQQVSQVVNERKYNQVRIKNQQNDLFLGGQLWDLSEQ